MTWQGIMKKRSVRISLQILFFVVLYLGLRAYKQWDMVTGPAPQIMAISLQQKAINLHDSQKPTLIHFWATWCPICKFEQDSIEALSKDYNVITVAMQSGSDQDVRDYLRENKLSFQVINDTKNDIVSRYGVFAVPASFVVDANNDIVAREAGYTTELGLRLRLWLADWF